MRVIKYPEPEEEKFITCTHCAAQLAYVDSDCVWQSGISGESKYIVCPCCNHQIIVELIPYHYAQEPRPLEFWWEQITCNSTGGTNNHHC